MSSKPLALKFTKEIIAPAAEIYTAFTNATAFCEWLCNVAQADAREGGRLYLWWNSGYYASGEYVSLRPAERIAFTWHGRGEPAVTRVKVSLLQDKDTTIVTLQHSELGEGKEWKALKRDFKRGWEEGLQNLKAVLETGQDLRFVRQPVFGVTSLEAVKPEMASRSGLTVSRGLRIGGVVPGMGAEAAGLQKDDVIFKVSGQRVASLSDVTNILQNHRSGDRIKISFYRGGEKHSVKMELSQRPLPTIPASAEELAEAVHGMMVNLDGGLSATLAGITEPEASYRPSPDEWNIRFVVAHLIASEREQHTWIASLIEGQEVDLGYHANLPTRIEAIAAAFPTLESLAAELRCNQAETNAMVSALPVEFVFRKRSYWRLAYNLLESPAHYQEHFEQIQKLAASARQTSAFELPEDKQVEMAQSSKEISIGGVEQAD